MGSPKIEFWNFIRELYRDKLSIHTEISDENKPNFTLKHQEMTILDF
jgi:hypothetical protein